MAVGKFGKIFSFFNKTSATEKILKAVQKGKMPAFYFRELQSVKNTAVRESLTDYISVFAKKTSDYSQMKKAIVYDIVQKLNMCDDALIKEQVETLIIGVNKKSHTKAFEDILKAELQLDSVNCATKKYSTLYCSRKQLNEIDCYSESDYKYAKSLTKKLLQKGNSKKAEEIMIRMEDNLSEPLKLSKYSKRHSINLPENQLTLEAQYNSLKSYIELHPKDKDTATYLWKQYFVSHQDRATQNILNDIYNDFGVRVCFNKKPYKDLLLALREHLSQYKKALGNKTKFPALFDINKDYYIFTENCGGYIDYNSSKIMVPEENILGTIGANNRYQAVRHEMAHLQDTENNTIIKRIINSIKEIINPIKKTDKLQQELRNSDIKDYLINYFFTNKSEAKAVFAECDMQKVSNEFKNYMVHKIKGLPEEIVNLRDISIPKCRLLAKFYNKQNNKIIEKLDEIFGGEIPYPVAESIIDNPAYFKLVKSICRKHPNGMTDEQFLKAFRSKIIEYRQGKAKGTNTDLELLELEGFKKPYFRLLEFHENIFANT